MAKEQTNGGSKLNIVIGEVITDENKEITMPPEKAKKLSIVTVSKIKDTIENNEYIEIPVGYHDVIKEGEKVVKRIAQNGKELTNNKEKKKSIDKKEITKE